MTAKKTCPGGRSFPFFPENFPRFPMIFPSFCVI